MVTQDYTISTVKSGTPPKVKMSQYDYGMRTITFSVVDGSGDAVDLTGKTVTVEGTRLDGHAFAAACTVADNTATFVDTVDMTNAAGDHPAELVIRQNDERLATMNFVISVEPAAMDEDAEITPEDRAIFDQLYEKLVSGSPATASTVAEMTNTDAVYLYTGSETGYINGNWYYYNGTAWVSGGTYGGSSITVDDELSNTSVNPVQNKVITEAIDELKSDKADKDGTYSTLTAGDLATEDGSENKVPYLFRASGGGVRVGEREYDKIVGGTVAHNQLVTGLTDRDVNGITAHPNGDGSITLNGTATAYTGIQLLLSSINVITGHVYFMFGYKNQTTTDYMGFGGTKIDGGSGGIYKLTAQVTAVYVRVDCREGTTYDNVRIYPQLVDLTQMFGTTIADYLYTLESGTAGAGVAKLKEWGFFSEPYYAYNAGELKSVEGLSSHEMVGFNAFDEVWESGSINADTGEPVANADWSRSKNYISVVPNTKYHFYFDGINDSTHYPFVFYYDINKGYLTVHRIYTYDNDFVLPDNCYYVKVQYKYPIASVLNYHCCVNIMKSGARNDEYEPYVKHTYPLDSTLTLRGIPKLDSNNSLYYDGDTYENDGTVTRRYGVLTPDNANKSISNINGHLVWLAKYGAMPATSTVYGYAISNMFVTATYNDLYLGATNMICINSQGRVYIAIDGVTDTDTLNAWLTAHPDFRAVYELDTATAETADPFAAPQIVDQYGTEEYVTTGLIPVGHETFYPENLRQKIEGLPWNFASLIAPTEVTYKATQNYTSGSLFIVDNILYKATANIANGGNITPGTNCTATTLAAVIAAL